MAGSISCSGKGAVGRATCSGDRSVGMSVQRRLLDRAGRSAERSGSCPGDPAIAAGTNAIAGIAAPVAARRDRDLSARLGLDMRLRVLPIGTEGVANRAIFGRIMDGDHAA